MNTCECTMRIMGTAKNKDGVVICNSCYLPLDQAFCECDSRDTYILSQRVYNGAEAHCKECGKPIKVSSKKSAFAEETHKLDQITVVSTPDIPGHRVTAVLGLVTDLTGASGLTAGIKGREALTGALRGLRSAAHKKGANAIIGMNASVFGAGGGLTNVFGGDAVGVMLIGTAVIIEPIPGEAPVQLGTK